MEDSTHNHMLLTQSILREDYHRGIHMHLLFVEPCTPCLTFPPCVHLSLCSLSPLYIPPSLPSYPSFIFPLCVLYMDHLPVHHTSSPPNCPYTSLYITTHLISIFFPLSYGQHSYLFPPPLALTLLSISPLT